MFWVISVYFNLRNTLPKFGTFFLGHPVYIYIYKSVGCVGYETVEAIISCRRSTINQSQHCKCIYDYSLTDTWQNPLASVQLFVPDFIKNRAVSINFNRACPYLNFSLCKKNPLRRQGALLHLLVREAPTNEHNRTKHVAD